MALTFANWPTVLTEPTGHAIRSDSFGPVGLALVYGAIPATAVGLLYGLVTWALVGRARRNP